MDRNTGRNSSKKSLNIPLIAHIHSTEYDRNGTLGCDPEIQKIEKEGLAISDVIITVSKKTKRDLINYYGIQKNKIKVVPNATKWKSIETKIHQVKQPNIMFAGRFTYQKGPERFIDLSRELVSSNSNFSFTMIGDGYLAPTIMRKIGLLNLSKYFKLTGFLSRKKLQNQLKKASVLVVPSVSEPFGIIALEATAMGIPIIIAEEAGVNEYINFKTFKHWDIHTMKKLIFELISSPSNTSKYVSKCQSQLSQLKWKKSIKKINMIYNEIT